MVHGAVMDLGSDSQAALAKAVESFMARHGTLRVASIFSGSDLGIVVIRTIIDVLNRSRTSRPLRLSHIFSCEKVPWKRRFIERMHQPAAMYIDAADLCKGQAPAVDFVMAGFVCRDMSTLSSRHPYYQQRLGQGVGASSETFLALVAYLEKKPPALLFLENVGGLAAVGQGKVAMAKGVAK